MSRNNNNEVDLSSASIQKISYALYAIKDIEQGVKSITFQDNIGVLNCGGSQIIIPLSTNLLYQLISATELENLNLEINNLKVN